MLVNKLTKEELRARRAAVAKVVAKHAKSLQDFEHTVAGACFRLDDYFKRLRRGELSQTTHIRVTASELVKALKELRVLMLEIRHGYESEARSV